LKYELGRRIACARKEKKLTQDGLARLMNVSRQAVSHWEQGTATPGFEALCRLVQLLPLNITDLLDGTASRQKDE